MTLQVRPPNELQKSFPSVIMPQTYPVVIIPVCYTERSSNKVFELKLTAFKKKKIQYYSLVEGFKNS